MEMHLRDFFQLKLTFRALLFSTNDIISRETFNFQFYCMQKKKKKKKHGGLVGFLLKKSEQLLQCTAKATMFFMYSKNL